MFALFFFLSQFLQEVQGYSPLRAGFAFLPMPLAIIAGSQLSSRIVARVGRADAAGDRTADRGPRAVPAVAAAPGQLLPAHRAARAITTFGVGMSFVPVTLAATTVSTPATPGWRPA